MISQASYERCLSEAFSANLPLSRTTSQASVDCICVEPRLHAERAESRVITLAMSPATRTPTLIDCSRARPWR